MRPAALSALASILMLAACTTTDPIGSSEPAARDVAAIASSLAGSTVLDVGKYQPTALVGGCDAAAAFPAATPLELQLVAALTASQAYSDSVGGTGLLVLHDGKLIHESYAKGLTADVKTNSYSMQKSLLALAYAAALDRSIISSLDDPAGKYIAQWKDDPRGAITLRQLLTMSSGLETIPFNSPEATELLYGADINKAALVPKIFAPAGSRFQYANFNSQIAGQALDNAVRKAGYANYAAFFSETIWCPLGNSDAELWLDREGGAPHFYAGMFARHADWARIGELIRHGGTADGSQVVSSNSMKQLLAPSATNPNYGIQIWLGNEQGPSRSYGEDTPMRVVQAEPFAADDVVFFDGFGGQRVYIVPSAKLTIVRTGFVNFGYDDTKIVNLILAGLPEA